MVRCGNCGGALWGRLACISARGQRRRLGQPPGWWRGAGSIDAGGGGGGWINGGGGGGGWVNRRGYGGGGAWVNR